MIALDPIVTASITATAPTGVAAMQWRNRVLLVTAPVEDDPRLHEQRRIVARWKVAAAERDLAVVEIVGTTVAGASDTAAALRRRYGLPTATFAVVLIGKDGGTKLRDERPIAAATLQETIDAMPMRRNGGR